jgi:hypothetical protein
MDLKPRWSVGYPILFKKDGDLTGEAILKLKKEVEKIYFHLNELAEKLEG